MPHLSFEIDYKNERAGWIVCWLTIEGERHKIYASNVFPPFMDLLNFVKAISIQRLPVKFFWDEEGHGPEFFAFPVAEDSPFVHLKIVYDNPEHPWVDAELERDAVVQAFLAPLLDLSKNFLKAETAWYFPRKDVERVKNAMEKGYPLRSDVNAFQPIYFSVKAAYEEGYEEGHTFLQANLDDNRCLDILLYDTNPFWREWITFLGQVASGDFPASCEHIRIVEFLPDEPPYRFTHCLTAEAVANPENFRLKIFTQEYDDEPFLFLNEVLNRQQCVRGFAEVFGEFLRENYQVYPDNDEKTFDLRTLPIDKLEI